MARLYLGPGEETSSAYSARSSIEVLGHPFAERQIDAAGVVDEEAQGLVPRLLEGNQVKLGIELGELLLNAVLEVCHAWFGPKKKWARPTSRTA